MDVRFATVDDGASPEQAARRTAFVVGNTLATTRFVTPTVVEVAGHAPSDEAFAALADEVTWWAEQVELVRWGSRAYENPSPLTVEWVGLGSLTVGQLTVSAPKVAAARTWVRTTEDVVLTCVRLDGETMIVDGSSRAVAAHRLGLDRVGIVTGEAAALHRETRRWCRAAGIVTVADLAEHEVDDATHRRLWVDRCQAWLAAQES